jgi:RNA polymerase sigma factor (sigma-70 family)
VDDRNDLLLELLAREGRSLHALLARLTLDEHAAEDLLQELFLSADRSPGFRTARNPAAYLRQMAINGGFAWRRGRSRQERVVEKGSVDAVDGAPGAEAKAMEREEWQQILDCAEKLSGLSREVFVLRFLQGLEFEAIAEELGKTPHQVRALASKAVAEVREQVRILEAREDSHAR